LERTAKNESKTDTIRREIAKQVVSKCLKGKEQQGMVFLNTIAYFDYDTSMSEDPPTPLTVEWVKWKKHQEEMKLAQATYEFDVGQVRTSTDDEELTHVIVNQNDLSRLSALKKTFLRPRLPRFVTLDWIQACISNHTIVNEVGKSIKVAHCKGKEANSLYFLDYLPKVPNQL
jgi:DNA ligase-4